MATFGAIVQVFDRDGKPQLPGASSIPDRSNWVEVTAWDFGRTGAGGRSQITSFNCTFQAKAELADFISRAVNFGTSYASARLMGYRVGDPGDDTGSQWYLQIDLRDVMFTSAVNQGPGGITLSVTFGQQAIVYREQLNDRTNPPPAPISVRWDQAS